MDNKRAIPIINEGSSPDPVQEDCDYMVSGDCKTDHGERTNYKLRDQPFYMRGRNGKMRKH